MSEAPDRIWLHRRDPEDGFGAASTWSEDQIEDWDVEYVRADAPAAPDPHAEVAQLRAELAAREAEVARLRAIQDEIRNAARAMLPGYVPAPEASVLWLLKVIGTDMESLRIRADVCEQRLSGPRTDAEWRDADRRLRINDLAARYAGQGMRVVMDDSTGNTVLRDVLGVVHCARALAAAVVEAEE